MARFFLWVVAALLVTSTSIAQSAADLDPDAVEAAKGIYKQGAAAFSDGRYKDAIDLFLRANKTAPVPAFSFNIGVAYQEMGDDARALRWYRDYRRRSPDGTDLGDVEERIGAMEAKLQAKGLQQVTILTQPSGATVRVDGQAVGVTPWTGELIPGTHKAQVTMRGYEDTEQSFELQAHRAIDVDIELSAKLEDESPAPAVAAPVEPSRAAEPDQGPAATGPTVGIPTWIFLGAGVATLGVAGFFEMQRSSAISDAENAPNSIEGARLYDDAESHQTMARILAGVGGALTITGAVLLTLDLTSGPSESAAVGCAGDGCAAFVRGRF